MLAFRKQSTNPAGPIKSRGTIREDEWAGPNVLRGTAQKRVGTSIQQKGRPGSIRRPIDRDDTDHTRAPSKTAKSSSTPVRQRSGRRLYKNPPPRLAPVRRTSRDVLPAARRPTIKQRASSARSVALARHVSIAKGASGRRREGVGQGRSGIPRRVQGPKGGTREGQQSGAPRRMESRRVPRPRAQDPAPEPVRRDDPTPPPPRPADSPHPLPGSPDPDPDAVLHHPTRTLHREPSYFSGAWSKRHTPRPSARQPHAQSSLFTSGTCSSYAPTPTEEVISFSTPPILSAMPALSNGRSSYFEESAGPSTPLDEGGRLWVELGEMLGDPGIKPPTPMYRPVLGKAITAVLNARRVGSTLLLPMADARERADGEGELHRDVRAVLDGLRDGAEEQEQDEGPEAHPALPPAPNLPPPVLPPLHPVEPLRLRKRSTRRRAMPAVNAVRDAEESASGPGARKRAVVRVSRMPGSHAGIGR